MGYIVNAVQTGLGYAEKYQLPELINKARVSSTAVDKTVSKLDSLLREQGTPLMKKMDSKLDSSLVAVTCKKAELTEFTSGKIALAKEFKDEKVAQVTAKVETTKKFTYGQVADKKAMLYKKAEGAVETSKAQISVVQSKAVTTKACAEKKLTTGAKALDAKFGTAHASKATTYALENANTLLAYSYSQAESMISAATDLPALVQKRYAQGLAYTSETKAYVAAMPAKVMALFLVVKVQLLIFPTVVKYGKAQFQASFEKGTIQADAKTLYADVSKLALAKKALLEKSFAAKTASAKTLFAETSAKAKVEVAKIKPFMLKTQGKASAVVAQAKEQVNAFLAKTKKA
jgi:hypothetical protein